jgi:putative hemolysin
MKKFFILTIILMALTACAVPQALAAPDPAATDMPQAGMSNPASVYCEQNGNELEIRIADDGSQNGICVFLDGSTCDEWAYYRGECGLAAQDNSAPALTVEVTPKASGGDPGVNNSGENNASGGYIPPGAEEKIPDWWGIIKRTESGAQ